MNRYIQHRYVITATALVALFLANPEVSRAAVCSTAQGQAFIDQGRYDKAIQQFTCVIDADPTGVEGYRGRIEAQLLLGRFSDAVGDYVRGVTALVIPVHPDAATTIINGYVARLAASPQSIPALTGLSFARWWFFQYAQAVSTLNDLLAIKPNDVYGNLFRGSCRLLGGTSHGVEDIDRAIALAPNSADVHFIAADAYTYGLSDPQRALAEGSAALNLGLDTPRVRAILGAAYNALGDQLAAAIQIQRHFELVTTDLVTTSPLPVNVSFSLPIVPGQAYKIPIAATAGQTISIGTNSHDFGDTILLLLDPGGAPIAGRDDDRRYFAELKVVAAATGLYHVLVSSFEAVSTGDLEVIRK